MDAEEKMWREKIRVIDEERLFVRFVNKLINMFPESYPEGTERVSEYGKKYVIKDGRLTPCSDDVQ